MILSQEKKTLKIKYDYFIFIIPSTMNNMLLHYHYLIHELNEKMQNFFINKKNAKSPKKRYIKLIKINMIKDDDEVKIISIIYKYNKKDIEMQFKLFPFFFFKKKKKEGK